MQPRIIRRLVLLPPRHKRSANTPIRYFTPSYGAPYTTRPQLPFLSIPSRVRQQQWRHLTTERKAWIKQEILLGIKYTAYIWAIFICLAGIWFTLAQEFLEHDYPTPKEWTLRSRMLKRDAEYETQRPDLILPNWGFIIQLLQHLIGRLEDGRCDGKGLRDMGPEKPAGSKDISAMAEPWRRGYYEALLLCARASEHVEGWVLDTTRSMLFPPDVVKGPSNPNRRPVPTGVSSAPREEDCVPAGFPYPDECYLKLLATEGLTTRQRIDATLAYANWLEHKGLTGPAAVMYDDAVDLAVAQMQAAAGDETGLLDARTGALKNDRLGCTASANLLTSLTALATFKARQEDASAALPMLVSILKARQSLADTAAKAPTSSKQQDDELLSSVPGSAAQDTDSGPIQAVVRLLTPPPYPPPPADGTSPPVRDSRELCEEAALHLHIGEIMYTMKPSRREDGLAWTREGVDLAEEELHKVLLLRDSADSRAAKKTCRECLASGLDNWAVMVSRMAKDEEAARTPAQQVKKSAATGWLGFWSAEQSMTGLEDGGGGRWAAEQKVVMERKTRAQPILEDIEKPPSLLGSTPLMA